MLKKIKKYVNFLIDKLVVFINLALIYLLTLFTILKNNILISNTFYFKYLPQTIKNKIILREKLSQQEIVDNLLKSIRRKLIFLFIVELYIYVYLKKFLNYLLKEWIEVLTIGWYTDDIKPFYDKFIYPRRYLYFNFISSLNVYYDKNIVQKKIIFIIYLKKYIVVFYAFIKVYAKVLYPYIEPYLNKLYVYIIKPYALPLYNFLKYYFSKYVVHYVVMIKKFLSDKEKIFVKKHNEAERKWDEIEEKRDKIIKTSKVPKEAEVVNTLSRRQRTLFYFAGPSIWPLYISLFMFFFIVTLVTMLQKAEYVDYVSLHSVIAIAGGCFGISFWISAFYKEKKFGYHTSIIRRNIELGFYIFIGTEIICFLSLFWVFLHSFLATSIHVGAYNPGEGVTNIWVDENVEMKYWRNLYYWNNEGVAIAGIDTVSNICGHEYNVYCAFLQIVHINFIDKGKLIDPDGYPWKNTLILLTSAGVLNLSHVSMKNARYFQSFFFLCVVIILGLYFITVQYSEFKNCKFKYFDGQYAACFYSLTGLHGIHVILGVFALFVSLIYLLTCTYTQKRHQTFWFSILYWHFVDVVRIFVYLIMYKWPANPFYKDVPVVGFMNHGYHCVTITTDIYHSIVLDKIKILKQNLTFILYNDIMLILNTHSGNAYTKHNCLGFYDNNNFNNTKNLSKKFVTELKKFDLDNIINSKTLYFSEWLNIQKKINKNSLLKSSDFFKLFYICHYQQNIQKFNEEIKLCASASYNFIDLGLESKKLSEKSPFLDNFGNLKETNKKTYSGHYLNDILNYPKGDVSVMNFTNLAVSLSVFYFNDFKNYNFNEIKRDPEKYAIFLSIAHDTLYNYINIDLYTKIKKEKSKAIVFFAILHLFSETLSWNFAYRFLPALTEDNNLWIKYKYDPRKIFIKIKKDD